VSENQNIKEINIALACYPLASSNLTLINSQNTLAYQNKTYKQSKLQIANMSKLLNIEEEDLERDCFGC